MAAPVYSKDQVLLAVKGCFGIISKVASNLGGCSWNTARKYVNRWEETRRAYADENERALDLSESKLLEQVNAGDGQMIRFHLATKGRNRGYVTKSEVEQSGETRVVIEYAEDIDGAAAEAARETETVPE